MFLDPPVLSGYQIAGGARVLGREWIGGGGAAAAELATGVDGRRAPARGAATAVPAGGTRTKIKIKPSQALIFFHDAELVFTSLAAPSAKRRRHCMRYHCWSYRHCACSSLPVQEGVAITVRYT
jgi:hypothetical protein